MGILRLVATDASDRSSSTVAQPMPSRRIRAVPVDG
jgi:hypothetical protein